MFRLVDRLNVLLQIVVVSYVSRFYKSQGACKISQRPYCDFYLMGFSSAADIATSLTLGRGQPASDSKIRDDRRFYARS